MGKQVAIWVPYEPEHGFEEIDLVTFLLINNTFVGVVKFSNMHGDRMAYSYGGTFVTRERLLLVTSKLGKALYGVDND